MDNQNKFDDFLKTLNADGNSYIKFFNDFYNLKDLHGQYLHNSMSIRGVSDESKSDISKINNVMIDENVPDTSLKDLLLSYIYKKKYKSPNDFIKNGRIVDIDQKFFNQIMSGKRRPGKDYTLKLSVALELNRDDFGELLKITGYCLQNNPLDKIVLFCVKEQVFDHDKIDTFCKHFEIENIFWKELSNVR